MNVHEQPLTSESGGTPPNGRVVEADAFGRPLLLYPPAPGVKQGTNASWYFSVPGRVTYLGFRSNCLKWPAVPELRVCDLNLNLHLKVHKCLLLRLLSPHARQPPGH